MTLSFTSFAWSVRKCAVIASLASSCPLLKEFTCADAEDSSMQAISEAVMGWKNLQVLHVGPVDDQLLTHASSLQTLQELYFSVSSNFRIPVLEFCSPRVLIIISAPTLSSVQAFVQHVPLSIRRLYFHCSGYDNSFPKNFFSRLQACVVHPGELTELGLYVTKSDEDAGNESIVLNSCMLHPLLSFKALDCLDLGEACTTHIDDTFLKEMAQFCPHLEELHLGDENYWLITPLLTLDEVRSLLKHCR